MQGCCKRVQNHEVAETKARTASFISTFGVVYLLTCTRLIFYESVGKEGGVAAKAFDHGVS